MVNISNEPDCKIIFKQANTKLKSAICVAGAETSGHVRAIYSLWRLFVCLLWTRRATNIFDRES